jgi:capsid protein
VRWMPRGWAWVDPAKEVEAYALAVRNGFKTLSEVVAEQGGDLEELMRARRQELDEAEQLDLKFDTDPSADVVPAGNAAAANDNGTDNPDTTDGSIA